MAEEQLTEIWDKLAGLLALYGMSLIGAIVILIVGLWFSGFMANMTRRLMSRSSKIDATLTGFVSSMVRYAIIVFTVIAVLGKFGVQTASLVAVVGALGLAVGLALQGTLANFAAGVMLLLFRPFKAGHYVDAGGIAGTVKAITLFSTEMDTPDNIRITVPNGQIWGQSIRNFSHHDTRRLDVGCGISYDDDIDKALDVMKKVAAADSRVLKDPEINAFTDQLADSSVNLVVRVWCASGDYWALKWDLNKAVKQAFDKAGIDIPFPHQSLIIKGNRSDEVFAKQKEQS